MRHSLSDLSPRQTWLLILLVIAALLAGLGLREPMPADEPRFVLAAKTMVETSQWLFPQRGIELYAEKPPTFMWLQAASYVLVRSWDVAFLLPSLLAALLTLWLTGDLARRLWGKRTTDYTVLGLFVCLQFVLQAKRAQIDMVLVGMTTLSLWALVRYLLEKPSPWLLMVGTFAAGLGTVTKGVGFLPLLVFVPWLWVRWKSPHLLPSHRGVHVLAGIAGFVLGAGVWLVPMLATVAASSDPALHTYAREMLFKQTGTRYANAWHHVKPAWYYLQTMLTLWLPGVLLAPWLLPAWWRRVRRVDPRYALLLGWALLVLVFFSASPGKREVYIFPMLPALALAASPLLAGLLRRRGVRAVLWSYLSVVITLTGALGLWLLTASPERVQGLLEGRGMDMSTVKQVSGWLLAFTVVSLVVMVAARRRVVFALVAVTASLGTSREATVTSADTAMPGRQRPSALGSVTRATTVWPEASGSSVPITPSALMPPVAEETLTRWPGASFSASGPIARRSTHTSDMLAISISVLVSATSPTLVGRCSTMPSKGAVTA